MHFPEDAILGTSLGVRLGFAIGGIILVTYTIIVDVFTPARRARYEGQMIQFGLPDTGPSLRPDSQGKSDGQFDLIGSSARFPALLDGVNTVVSSGCVVLVQGAQNTEDNENA